MTDHGFRSSRGRYAIAAIAVIANTLLTWMTIKHFHPAFSMQYIDPGSGLLLWQLVAASAAGFVFNVRGRIVELIKHIRIKKH